MLCFCRCYVFFPMLSSQSFCVVSRWFGVEKRKHYRKNTNLTPILGNPLFFFLVSMLFTQVFILFSYIVFMTESKLSRMFIHIFFFLWDWVGMGSGTEPTHFGKLLIKIFYRNLLLWCPWRKFLCRILLSAIFLASFFCSSLRVIGF